jgi:hypothetical protein
MASRDRQSFPEIVLWWFLWFSLRAFDAPCSFVSVFSCFGFCVSGLRLEWAQNAQGSSLIEFSCFGLS